MSAWAVEGTTTMMISAPSSASFMSEVTEAKAPNPLGTPGQLSSSIPPRFLMALTCSGVRL